MAALRLMLRNVPGSVGIARLFGIDINIHFSWLLRVVLVVLNLAGSFPQQFPQWSNQKGLVVASITAFLFFGSVLAHELAHSLVARRFQMSVSSITLFLLGGVANLRKEPPSAKAEFFMAIAGPATSVVIGVVGLGAAYLIDPRAPLSNAEAIQAVAAYLGTVNLYLAAFNMIPGFPLDGGRVLRSLPVVSGEGLIGLVAIGDLRKVDQARWAETPVEDVMTPASELSTVSPDDPLGTALERFGTTELPLLPVIKDGRLVGILYRESVIGYVRMQEMLVPEGRR